MSSPFRRILFSLAVLLWSAVLLYFYAMGRVDSYLAPSFRWIAFFGGLGLAVLGSFNFLTAWQNPSSASGCEHGCGGGCGHDHESVEIHPLLVCALMVVPVVCAAQWTRDAYSSQALARKGLYDTPGNVSSAVFSATRPTLTRDELEKNRVKTPDGFYELSLMEIFFAAGDREMQSTLEGQKVETIGRWVAEQPNPKNPGGTRKRLYRLFITCCAADSRAIPIVLEFGAAPPDLPENSWVKAAGTLRFPVENGELHPVVTIERVAPAEPPSEDSFMRN